MSYPLQWLRAFVITLLLEEAVAVPLLKASESSLGRRIGVVFIANIATHPLVWFFFPRLGWSWSMVILAAEAWAVGFEAFVYALMTKGKPVSRAIAASALANAVSYSLGLIAMKAGLLG